MRRERGRNVSEVKQHGQRWRFTVRVGAGRTREAREICSYPTEQEANRKRNLILKQIGAEEAAAAALTWRGAVDAYCDDKAGDLKPSSLDTLRGRLVRYFRPVLDLHLSGTLDASLLYRALQGTVSVQEHRHCLSRAKAFAAWLVERGDLKVNPVAKVKAVGKPNRGKPQLTRDEWRQAVRWCVSSADKGDEGAAAVAALLLLGVRASELCGLTTRDLDDGGRVLHVRGTKTAAASRSLGVPHPTAARPDTVDLRSILLAQATRAQRLAIRARTAATTAAPVYLWARVDEYDGGAVVPRDRWWVQREVARCCGEAGVPQVPPHGLRGTWATLARAVAVAPMEVAATMGHAGTDVQDRHYVRPGAAVEGHQAHVDAVLRSGQTP